MSELGPNGQPLVKPVQVLRALRIDNAPSDLNLTFKRLLAGSVWANYQLVSTQWTVNATVPGWKQQKLVPIRLTSTRLTSASSSAARSP